METSTGAGENLRRTRALTADLVAPAEACSTCRLYLRLQQFEAELNGAHPPENNVLFKRALCA